MARIDFVPNDYIQQKESSRANLLYLILFAIFMAAIGAAFSVIKIRQHAVDLELQTVDLQMQKAHEQITQLEELQNKRQQMMKTAVTTAQLIEPVPRSVLLACLINNLPNGVTLLELDIEQEEPRTRRPATQYQTKTGTDIQASPEKILETSIEIKGVAPTDIGVAGYIARLGQSDLISNVELVESKEYKRDELRFREFKLKAMLKKDVNLSRANVETIRSKGGRTM